MEEPGIGGSRSMALTGARLLESPHQSRLPFSATFLSAGALILVVLLLLASISYSLKLRDVIIDRARQESHQLAHLVAENASRAVETVDVVLDVFVARLKDGDWHRWGVAQGVAELKEYRTRRNIPQLRDLLIFNSAGDQVFMASIWPIPKINVADRPYFIAHRQGAPNYLFGPYIGRNTGTPTFAITRRITDAEGAFDGVLMASFEPSYFERVCDKETIGRIAEVALVNETGIVVASCSNRAAAGRPADQVLAEGRLAGRLSVEPGHHDIGGFLVSLSGLDGHPGLRVLVVTQLDQVLADWLSASLVQWLVGVLTLAALFALASLIRARHFLQIHQSTVLEQAVLTKSAELVEAKGAAETALETERQALAEQRNFLAMVSHEFRMPLAIIDGASQVMSLCGGVTGEAKEELAKIDRAVNRMASLIGTYLSEDRLCTGDLPYRPVEFDLHPVLASVCQVHSSQQGGPRLTLDSPDKCPVHGDPDLLRILFDNLIGNAFKFSSADMPISVTLERDGLVTVVTVADLGVGIHADDQVRIFEKYFRSPRANSFQGAGLGLYIVRRILDLHGGTITVRSSPGQGAVFVVLLPDDPTV